MSKERIERLYAEVKAISPELYENVVNIASTTPNLELQDRAVLERRIMGLVASVLSLLP